MPPYSMTRLRNEIADDSRRRRDGGYSWWYPDVSGSRYIRSVRPTTYRYNSLLVFPIEYAFSIRICIMVLKVWTPQSVQLYIGVFFSKIFISP